MSRISSAESSFDWEFATYRPASTLTDPMGFPLDFDIFAIYIEASASLRKCISSQPLRIA
jgi:hypothetical protein